jgi:hypothetical protein
MAKAKKKAPAKGSPAAKAEAAASYKFGIPEIAKMTGRKDTSVRVAFRKHGIEKAEGGVYGWNSQKDVDAVIAKAFPAKATAKEAKKLDKKADKKAGKKSKD